MLRTTRCPRCAKHLPAGAAFCRRCGRDLRAPHGLAGPPGSAPARRLVRPPPLPTANRGSGRFAIFALALFVLLFVAGVLFSKNHALIRAKPPSPPPAEHDGGWESGNRGDDAEMREQRAPPKRDW